MSELTQTGLEAISKAVKDYRIVHNLSQKKFAEMSMISLPQISKLERGLPVKDRTYKMVASQLGFRNFYALLAYATSMGETENKETKPVEPAEQNKSHSDEQLIKEALARFEKTTDMLAEATAILKSSEKLVIQGKDLGRVLSNREVYKLLTIFKQIID